MSVHKAQRRALKAFNKSVRTLIDNNRVPSIDFKAVELKTRQDAGEMKVAELKKQLKDLGASASGKKEELIDALVDAVVAYHNSKPTTADILRKVAEANGVEIPEHMTSALRIATHMRINNIHRNATVDNPTGDA
jgi:pyridoxal biosynthesis lyase PdxS